MPFFTVWLPDSPVSVEIRLPGPPLAFAIGFAVGFVFAAFALDDYYYHKKLFSQRD